MPETNALTSTTAVPDTASWQCTSCMHVQDDDPDTLGVCTKCAGPLEKLNTVGQSSE